MYQRGYGIIKTLAPLHVGATAGEESGNLNLIFRDQFTQTGTIPGSSIRGRLRAEMRQRLDAEGDRPDPNPDSDDPDNPKYQEPEEVCYWYGRASETNRSENYNYEAIVKIEHASLVWLPVFCPGQPIVWVSCPRLLERYQRIAGVDRKLEVPDPYTGSRTLQARPTKKNGQQRLFFNLGFLTIEKPKQDLSAWFPDGKELPAVVVDDRDIGMIHDMALYRQSRVKLNEEQKVVDGKAFFNVEALPEGTILAFPFALKPSKKTWDDWKPLDDDKQGDLYLGGLESVGFGHCTVKLDLLTEHKEQA